MRARNTCYPVNFNIISDDRLVTQPTLTSFARHVQQKTHKACRLSFMHILFNTQYKEHHGLIPSKVCLHSHTNCIRNGLLRLQSFCFGKSYFCAMPCSNSQCCAGSCAVHLVAGSTTSPILIQFAHSELARPLENASVERFARAKHVFTCILLQSIILHRPFGFFRSVSGSASYGVQGHSVNARMQTYADA